MAQPKMIISVPGKGRQTYVVSRVPLVVGSGAKCHIQITAAKEVAKRHVVISKGKRAKSLKIEDLGSGLSTLYQGEVVQERELEQGDEIQIGDTKLYFVFPPRRERTKDNEAEADQFELVGLFGPVAGKRFSLDEPVTVGRAKGSTIKVADPSVSSNHAVFEANRGRVSLCDFRSRNGSRLNGEAVTPERPVAMEPGDLVDIGPITLVLVPKGFEVPLSSIKPGVAVIGRGNNGKGADSRQVTKLDVDAPASHRASPATPAANVLSANEPPVPPPPPPPPVAAAGQGAPMGDPFADDDDNNDVEEEETGEGGNDDLILESQFLDIDGLERAMMQTMNNEGGNEAGADEDEDALPLPPPPPPPTKEVAAPLDNMDEDDDVLDEPITDEPWGGLLEEDEKTTEPRREAEPPDVYAETIIDQNEYDDDAFEPPPPKASANDQAGDDDDLAVHNAQTIVDQNVYDDDAFQPPPPPPAPAPPANAADQDESSPHSAMTIVDENVYPDDLPQPNAGAELLREDAGYKPPEDDEEFDLMDLAGSGGGASANPPAASAPPSADDARIRQWRAELVNPPRVTGPALVRLPAIPDEDGSGADRHLELPETLQLAGNMTLGRRKSNNLRLPHAEISGQHAFLTSSPDGSLTIRDNGSLNGTYVNGVRTEGEVPVPAYAEVVLGPYRFFFLPKGHAFPPTTTG